MLSVAKIATLNPVVLKELSVEDVLDLHPLIDASQLNFVKVQKTKPIKVKALSTILSDDSLYAKLLLATLEGHQDLKASSFVCWGVDNDVWQCSHKAIHSKYRPVSLDEQGWTLFEPLPNNPVNACQITEDLGLQLGECGGFSVTNPKWGDQRVVDGKSIYLHYGVVGDFVMLGLDSDDDYYRIDKKFFKNTYEVL
jgi:hypothetical protein